MTRAQAQTAVAALIKPIAQAEPFPAAQGVPRDAVLNVLSAERFEKLMRDPIRKNGPAAGYVYPWNVVDYLDEATKLGQDGVSSTA